MRRRFQKRIYIPLPNESARFTLFKLHFGKKGHDLTDDDFREMAKMTEGYSGSDIANISHAALNYPIRVLQRSKWFKKDEEGMYVPCKEGEGERNDVFKLPKGQVRVPIFHREDIPVIMKRATKTTAASELGRYTEWMKNFGEDGVQSFVCCEVRYEKDNCRSQVNGMNEHPHSLFIVGMPPKKTGARKKREKMKAAQVVREERGSRDW